MHPERQRGKEGWSAMAEVVWDLTAMINRREEKRKTRSLKEYKLKWERDGGIGIVSWSEWR